MITTLIINDSDTGFTGITPDLDDVKRYFNGWKYVDGTDWDPIGYDGDAVDAATALANLVTDIYPNSSWRPYTFIYGLEEAIDVNAYAQGALESYHGINVITSNEVLSAYINVDKNADVIGKLMNVVDEIKSRINSVKERIESLEGV